MRTSRAASPLASSTIAAWRQQQRRITFKVYPSAAVAIDARFRNEWFHQISGPQSSHVTYLVAAVDAPQSAARQLLHSFSSAHGVLQALPKG